MFGRLGTGAEKDELLPVQLNFGYPNPNGTEGTFKIVGIAAGAYHSLALAGYLTLHTSHLPISLFSVSGRLVGGKFYHFRESRFLGIMIPENV